MVGSFSSQLISTKEYGCYFSTAWNWCVLLNMLNNIYHILTFHQNIKRNLAWQHTPVIKLFNSYQLSLLTISDFFFITVTAEYTCGMWSTTSFFKKSKAEKFFTRTRLTRIMNSLRDMQSDIDGNHVERGKLETSASGRSSGRWLSDTLSLTAYRLNQQWDFPQYVDVWRLAFFIYVEVIANDLYRTLVAGGGWKKKEWIHVNHQKELEHVLTILRDIFHWSTS